MNVEAVILAAGLSSRAGAFKMELEYEGKKLLERCIEVFYGICSRVIVVGGFKVDRIHSIADAYPGVEVVLNSSFQEGMFSSVREGMRHVRGERFFLTPGDCPLLNEKVCLRMLKEQQDMIVPAYNGRKGHPVLLKGSLAEEILKEPEDSNLKAYINRKGYKLVDVEDEGVLIDIDTQEDYERLKSRNSGT